MATVFEPIRPVPPMTTIFMVYPRLSTSQSCNPGVNIEAVGLVRLKSATLGVLAVHAAGVYRPNVAGETRSCAIPVTPMLGLASIALAASMSSPPRLRDWLLAVTAVGHKD